jgi:hypothetical protein
LAKYIVRACFSQERLIYIPMEKSADGVAKVIYTSNDGRMVPLTSPNPTRYPFPWHQPVRVTVS